MTRCYFCGSGDSMHPFQKPSKVLLLSLVWPRLRRFYCRSCARHFWGVIPNPQHHENEKHEPERFPTLDEVTAEHIRRALVRTRGRVEGTEGAAQLLGVKPDSLRARMRKLGINVKEYRKTGS